MSLYLAKKVTRGSPATSAFTTRGINTFTQAKLSDLNVTAVPYVEQIAYAGYVQNLEAFLYAKAINARVFCTLQEYPIPDEWVPTVPIPLPPIVLRINTAKPLKPFQDKLTAILEKLNGEKVELGKGNPTYIIKNPSYKALRVGLPPISASNVPFVTEHASSTSGFYAAKIIQLIDLFLCVQTYEYKGELDEENEFNARKEIVTKATPRYPGDLSETPGNSAKRRRLTEEGTFETTTVEFMAGYSEATKSAWTKTSMDQSVLTAKPSPHSSSYNYGGPQDVPFKPGFFFPYFDGMLVPDTGFIRECVISLFMRSIGTKELDVKSAWKSFHQDIHTFSQTTSGMVVTHILAGCRLALQGQARLFLVFDEDSYKGFTLLGEQFDVYIGRSCLHPITAQNLKAELAKVATRRGSAQMLKSIGEAKGMMVVDEDKLMASSAYVVEVLVFLRDLEAPLNKEELEQVRMALSRLHFQKKFLAFSPANIKAALEDISQEYTRPDVPFYISHSAWKDIENPIHQILARFGPNSISFFNSKGTAVEIKSSIAAGQSVLFSPVSTKGRVLVYEKPLNVAYQEMVKVVKSGYVWQDEGERAAGQRAHTFVDGLRVTLAEGLISLRDHVSFGTVPLGGVSKDDLEPRFAPKDDINLDDF
jgi:hypothetical protein